MGVPNEGLIGESSVTTSNEEVGHHSTHVRCTHDAELILALGGAAVAGGAGLGLYTWQVEPHWVEVVRRPLPLPHLPPALRRVGLKRWQG
jgi:hypothetical protein